MKKAAILLLAAALLAAGILLELMREPQFIMVAYREYDADGKLLYEKTCDENGNVLTDGSTKYIYERGKLVRKEEYAASRDDPFALLKRLTEYDYDLFGRIKEERWYTKMEAVVDHHGTLTGVEPVLTYILRCEYDGSTVTTLCYEPDGETVVESTVETYDSKGRKISLYNYYPPDKLYMYKLWEYGDYFTNEEHYYDHFDEEAELTYREKHVYDEDGREISGEFFDSFYGEQPWVHTFDDAGNLVETNHYDLEGKLWRTERYEYADGKLVRYDPEFYNLPTQRNKNAMIDHIEDPRNFYGRGKEYAYNDDGLLAEMTILNRWDYPESTTTYSYDEFENCIREEFVTESGGYRKIIEREFVRSYAAPTQP